MSSACSSRVEFLGSGDEYVGISQSATNDLISGHPHRCRDVIMQAESLSAQASTQPDTPWSTLAPRPAIVRAAAPHRTPIYLTAFVVVPCYLLYSMISASFSTNLPIISSSLNIDISQAQWIIHTELIVCCGFSAIVPKLSERLGLNRVFLAGAFLFAVVTFLMGFLGNSYASILVLRIISSIGLAMMLSLANTMAYFMSPRKDLSVVLTISNVCTPIGQILSSFLSGWIAYSSKWQYIYILIGCLSAVHAAYSVVLCPNFPTTRGVKFDVVGTLLMVASITLLIFSLSASTVTVPWWGVTICFILAIVFFILFVFWNKQWCKNPLFPPTAFNKSVLLNMSALCMISAFGFGERFFLPYTIVIFYNYSRLSNGGFLVIGGVLSIIFSPLFSLSTKRVVSRLMLMMLSLISLLLVLIEAFFLQESVALPIVFSNLCLICFIGCLITVQTTAVVNTPVMYISTLGSLNSIMLNFGHSLGVTTAVTTQNVVAKLGGVSNTNLPNWDADPGARTAYGLSLTFGILSCISFSITLFLLAIFMGVLKSDRGKLGFSERRLSKTKHFSENINNNGEMIEVQESSIAFTSQQVIASLFQPKFI
ncbi:TM efflux protein [Giardia duodenalis]|uniref:TM efflux protein n=1 Tax=Giardia intestinalis (strain ATCC 50803 / WB clone C6) TaxID=184922 RepID=A8B243_GIAIC|nr:TM efflux protein [Giardia intestinalis]KAE8302916.1 TM efflux protein [Giardia intestinalis]|eukprot:XP_001709894.1 TM efflux prot [Giardia lamblia ATCC 50803]